MPVFGAQSKKQLAMALPQLQSVLNEAIQHYDFKILDAVRGKAAQERAVLRGQSKVHFGESAHNWVPCIAVDLFPAPYDWNNKKAFADLYHVMMAASKKLNIPIRSGLDWNMDGLGPHDTDNWDGGHYELHPWRSFRHLSHLYVE